MMKNDEKRWKMMKNDEKWWKRMKEDEKGWKKMKKDDKGWKRIKNVPFHIQFLIFPQIYTNPPPPTLKYIESLSVNIVYFVILK